MKAPAADGRANAALVKLMADSLGLAKGQVEIITGKRSRSKLLALGMDKEAFDRWASAVSVIEKE